MKTVTFSLAAAALLALSLVAVEAQAQSPDWFIRIGDFNIGSNRGFNPGGFVPGGRQRNPVIDQGFDGGSMRIDPRTGRWIVNTNGHTIHRSAMDPNRNQVDPGSLRRSSSISRDAFGNQMETTVTSWTSFGRPHSTTNVRRIQNGRNGTVIDNQVILRSTNPNANDQNP
ncbi:hypothetical protein ETAA8_02060 [Anatilimnocola aggregata]|uniref:Uncharacterized protein n=1 Tax=Anatilimnocola aggregata TaxID=2528021 RepID=A0A517Y4H4_9BACT|nr:hypothetical protein [Anatilimnocola aggregata]QDU25144.1 hypothetical protein ETAA8_02060 [Anatilimnocola aggregata]